MKINVLLPVIVVAAILWALVDWNSGSPVDSPEEPHIAGIEPRAADPVGAPDKSRALGPNDPVRGEDSGAREMVVQEDVARQVTPGDSEVMVSTEAHEPESAPSLTDEIEFPFSCRVVAGAEKSPVEGCAVTLTRIVVGGESANPARTIVEKTTIGGTARIDPLLNGRWRLEVAKEGFDTVVEELDLPGAWAKVLATTGVVDLGDFVVHPTTFVPFRLVGTDSWSDSSGFFLESLEKRDASAVSATGDVELKYGWLPSEFQVCVTYPDGAEGWEVFKGPPPSSDAPWEITVGGARRLEIDLRVTAEAKVALSGHKAYVRATFTNPLGGQRFIALAAEDQSIISFPQVQSDVVNIGLITVGEGQQVEWAVDRVEMRPTGTTTAVLLVDSEPNTLAFRDESEVPITGARWTARPRVSGTQWLAGGYTNAKGQGLAPRISRSCELYLNVFPTETTALLINHPVDLATPGNRVNIQVGPSEATYFDVSSGGVAVSNARALLFGDATGGFVLAHEINGAGPASGFQLAQGSNAAWELELDGYWWLDRRAKLRPGRNALEVFPIATIIVPDMEWLGSISSTAFGSTLEEWRSKSLIQETVGRGERQRGLSYSIPAGGYALAKIGGAEGRQIEVGAGETIDLR